MRISDWSSDVCSSDLHPRAGMNMSLAVVKGDVTERLGRQIERLVGGRVTMLVRQPRWRTRWYAEVSRDGRTITLYLGGANGIEDETFPALAVAAAIPHLREPGGIKYRYFTSLKGCGEGASS